MKKSEKIIGRRKIRTQSVTTVPESELSSILTERPRVINVCKIYNISPDTLMKFLQNIGYTNLSNTTLLSNEILILIDKEFQDYKNDKDKIRGKTKVNFVNLKSNFPVTKQIKINPPDLTKETLFKHKVLHLDSNIFGIQKQEICYKNFQVIQSNFSDAEAINLCTKMCSSFTRNLCNQLNNTKNNKPLLIYQIHAIVNKALILFGGKILTFIYSLRNLQFKNKTASEIKNYDKVIPDFPIISFTSDNASFKISFFIRRILRKG